MAFNAAGMYGGAAFLGAIEGLMPGGPAFSLLPAFAALVIVVLLVAFGPRLPMVLLAALGPIGAALIALTLATTPGGGDGAVLYVWPVLYVAFFFGGRGAALIVVWVGVVHALALFSLSIGGLLFDRWLDVTVSLTVLAVVVQALARRNAELLASSVDEARTDPLTGLPNRRGFDEHAALALALARRENASVGVVTFDIDHFKRVNDEWGHDAGDRVLARLGGVFLRETRGADIVARMGGEEFVALLLFSDLEQSRQFAERVRAEVSDVREPGAGRVTLSAGVTAAIAPPDSGALLQVADSALYRAKSAGRDRTVVQSSERVPVLSSASGVGERAGPE